MGYRTRESGDDGEVSRLDESPRAGSVHLKLPSLKYGTKELERPQNSVWLSPLWVLP